MLGLTHTEHDNIGMYYVNVETDLRIII